MLGDKHQSNYACVNTTHDCKIQLNFFQVEIYKNDVRRKKRTTIWVHKFITFVWLDIITLNKNYELKFREISIEGTMISRLPDLNFPKEILNW